MNSIDGEENGGYRRTSEASKGGASNQSNSSTRRTSTEGALKRALQATYSRKGASQRASVAADIVTGYWPGGTTPSGKWCPPWMPGELGKPNAARLWTPHVIPPASEGVKAGEIIAWRGWYWDHNRKRLRSVFVDYEWPYDKPATGQTWNGYGIHAFKDLRDVNREYYTCIDDMIVGQVALWGDVVEFQRGYTAEFAKILTLYWPEKHREEVERLYGIQNEG